MTLHLCGGAPRVGTAGLEAVARGCPLLRDLALRGVDYDAALGAFHVCARLERLELGIGAHRAQHPDDGLMAIARAGGSKLREFACRSTHLSDVALLLVMAAAPQLHAVHVADCARLTNVICHPLLELKQLRALSIVDCAQVSQVCVDAAKRARVAADLPSLDLHYQPWDGTDEGDDNPWPPGVGTGW